MPKCGGNLLYKNYEERKRLTCSVCGIFMKTRIGVAVIVLSEDGQPTGQKQQLWPWCIPCGYVEYDEDVYEAAMREFKEETNLDVIIKGVYTVLSNFHNPETHTVGIWFMADIVGGTLQARADLDEVGYFDLTRPPVLAFPTDRLVIERLRHQGTI